MSTIGRLFIGKSGQEVLEMAFILPAFLMLFIGLFWAARAYNIWQTVTRAAREGARYAVLPSCAGCSPADVLVDTYSSVNTCLSNPTHVYTGYVLPALQADGLGDVTNSTQVPNGVYCQEAVVLNPDSDTKMQQCGVQVSITYPFKLVIPFTSANARTVNISATVRMRMENQSIDNASGNPQCPGNE